MNNDASSAVPPLASGLGPELLERSRSVVDLYAAEVPTVAAPALRGNDRRDQPRIGRIAARGVALALGDAAVERCLDPRPALFPASGAPALMAARKTAICSAIISLTQSRPTIGDG
jgi:hypothetical protein